MRNIIFILIYLLVLPGISFAGDDSQVIVDAESGKHKISKHIYGHFAEHLGRCIYGGIWVGEDSKIPNIKGYRKDIVEALKEIAIPNLRWPGGCFADIYHWQDGVGPKDQRPSILNYHWGEVTEDNSFGTHEFLNLCVFLGCKPYLGVNMGTGSPKDLKDWVLYTNSSEGNVMSNWRKKNGQDEPWRVKYWGIGNEAWGCGGNMDPEYYAKAYNHYATFCRDLNGVKNYRVACGPSGEYVEWTETLMRTVKPWLIQGISIHFYTVAHGNWDDKGSATDFNEDGWFEQIRYTLQMEDVIEKNAMVMDRYDPEKKIGMIIDEWGTWYNVEPGTEKGFLYQQNTLRDALVAGINLNIFNNNCERVKMTNIAQAVNVLQAVLLTKGDQMVRTPTWHVFKLFKPHHDAILLPVDVRSADYKFNGQTIPAISASASRDTGGIIHISLTNADPNRSQALNCEFRGALVSRVSGEIITANKMNALNDFGKVEEVKIQPFKKAKVDKNNIVVTLPPKSVVMLEVK